MVEGRDIDFTELPMQDKTQQFSIEQTCAIDSEIAELVKKAVIREANHSVLPLTLKG